ncbi:MULTISPECIES: hypothetical protein [unclassified Exiguobacterium]|uniref:hypothetical protein n=1 Tax=unclassified Exiguobacterium TaxID=2644629 RepID=UPI001BE5551C|nr:MULTISPECIES: hypothetical protein [unclassified Exiguobacterium]
MQQVTLRDVLATLDSVLSWSYLDRPEEMAIRGIGTTPEKINKTFLYVCNRPVNERGVDLVKAAIRNGAVAIITDRPIDARVPVIYCRDVTRAYEQLQTLFVPEGNHAKHAER